MCCLKGALYSVSGGMILELSVHYQILCQVLSQKKAETPVPTAGMPSTGNWNEKERNNNDNENNREVTAKKE